MKQVIHTYSYIQLYGQVYLIFMEPNLELSDTAISVSQSIDTLSNIHDMNVSQYLIQSIKLIDKARK